MLEKKLIESIGDLPTLPTVAARINAEMNNDALTAKSLGKIIADDTALASKIMRLSNSAFYGQAKQINNIDKAVMVLGFDTIRSLAMSVSIFSIFEKHIETCIDVEGLWRHSLGCAVAAKVLAGKSNKSLGDEAFLYGIIHDIGKIVFISKKFKEFELVLQISKEKDIPGSDAEIEIIGFSHQAIGAMLLDHWNFPQEIIAGVKMHHTLDADLKKLSPSAATLVRAVSVGNQMAKALSLGKSTDAKRQPIPEILWKFLGIKRDDLAALRNNINEDYGSTLEAWGMGE